MQHRERVFEFINGDDFDLGDEVQGHTSLIRSGLLDSLSLFKLALWIEGEVRSPIDITAIDIAEVWDTPDDIARFIEARAS